MFAGGASKGTPPSKEDPQHRLLYRLKINLHFHSTSTFVIYGTNCKTNRRDYR